jgi:tryptophan synthase beta chain
MIMPDKNGRFGAFGGQYVPETVMPVLMELQEAYAKYKEDPEFKAEVDGYLKDYAGRPTKLYYAERLTKHYGKAKIYLKREDLLHTGAHKINNALAQAVLAKKMGKKRIVAETGAGQHGVACATVAALFGMECCVFMGEEDIRRQSLNVFRMRLLGSKVIPVTSGTGTLKDATSEAIRYWASNINDTHYIIGSVVGPHPYPMIVRDFQAVIGEEIKAQVKANNVNLKYVVACVGGGSNAMGTFYPLKDDKAVTKIGVEAAGRSDKEGDHAKSLTLGRPGVLHGAYSYLLQTDDGQVVEAYSISAGLDYPGVGPEHSYFKDSGIVKYVAVDDKEALDAFQLLSRTEGIIPAVESSHALAYLEKLMPTTKDDEAVVVCLSGRGDKDVQMVASILGEDLK